MLHYRIFYGKTGGLLNGTLSLVPYALSILDGHTGHCAVVTAISSRDTKPMGKKGTPVPVLYTVETAG